jgi:hypothetical protein
MKLQIVIPAYNEEEAIECRSDTRSTPESTSSQTPR